MSLQQKPLNSHQMCQRVTELHHTNPGSLIWCQLLVLTFSTIAAQCFCQQGDTASRLLNFFVVRNRVCSLHSSPLIEEIQKVRKLFFQAPVLHFLTQTFYYIIFG